MSRAELESEIENLKQINGAQSLKIDEYEQKVYELKRHLSTSKAMEEHLSLEIESLQKNDKSENDELLKKISALEDEIHTLKQTNANTVQYYEAELQTKNNELENIIETAKSKPELNTEINRDNINKYTDEICDLKLKLEELTEQLLDYETKYQEISLRNNSFENQITALSSQTNELKDCLEVKKEELKESKELVRNLQDDMFVMQMEIEKFKSLPMEKAAKGNSLFAEVDDNRVKLQKTMETMKKKYMDMKVRYTSKCQELQKLHMEYAALIKVIENKNDTSDEKSELQETYERHFKRLNENVKSLENELNVQKQAYTKLISKDWKCAQEMISITRDEVQTLQGKLNTESLGLITSESNHYKTKRELKKWQAEAMQLRAQVLSLNQIIDDLKVLNSPTETTKDEPSNVFKKSCLKNIPTPLFSHNDWDLEEKFEDYSILNPNNTQIKDLNSTTNIINSNFADYSIFETTSLKNSNLFDELKVTAPNEESNKKNDTKEEISNKISKSVSKVSTTYQESNKEIDAKENISSNVLNDTMDVLTSKMKKVCFEENTVEPQKTGRIGGRKIINAKPIHIPSIKRN